MHSHKNATKGTKRNAGARTLLGAPGIATRTLLGAPTTRSKVLRDPLLRTIEASWMHPLSHFFESQYVGRSERSNNAAWAPQTYETRNLDRRTSRQRASAKSTEIPCSSSSFTCLLGCPRLSGTPSSAVST